MHHAYISVCLWHSCGMRLDGWTKGPVCEKKDINNQANVVQWWLILYLLIVFAAALATPTS